jgi:hypothetical protein
MTTTFQHVIDNVVEAKFTIREDTVIIGEFPKCYLHLLSPASPRNLEYNLLKYVRSTANAENIHSRNRGLRIQIDTEYPGESMGMAVGRTAVIPGKHVVSLPPAPYMPPIGNTTN